MSEPSPLRPSIPLTFSSADSPVRTSPQPERERVWRVRSPACFLKWRESFASWSPESSSWRTSQTSLILGFQLYSQKWPRAGIMRAGECSELTIHWSAHHTAAKGGSVSRGWPTPSAQTFDQSPEAFDARRERLKAKGINGNGAGRLLAVEVRRSWPTPVSGDSHCAGPNQHASTCGRAVRRMEGNGRLHPAWVEMLMGFPEGWTSLTDGPPLQDHSTHGSLPEPDHDSPMTGSD